jgi:hypothetical protein
MKNIELELIPTLRFCNVRAGEKIPYPAGWQNSPRTIGQIESSNVGLLLGESSQGIVALDFDGTTAWTWYNTVLNVALPKTIMWTSGKQDRCQMAFQVPEIYWPLVDTVKITHTRDPLIAKGEGFEFRWSNCQSVMPPSRLTDGRTYEWIVSPADSEIAELPMAIIDWWVLTCNPETTTVATQAYPPATTREVEELAEQLKNLYPTLDDYETWTKTTWAFCNTIGYNDGLALMKYYWPEQTPGEYDRLNCRPPSRPCGLGTIKRMINNRGGSNKLTQLELELKQKYNL